ncbi:cobalamin-binding protein [Bacillus alveayuensis]|jgi:iron complex transport system substrate-binding protein|uniref:cobalamin-binding protein n=1 Tax=Aeribacillus alveayuensis TaxID=279215 RepID=UPI0005CCD0F1|nr:cobalamin-binding protein [Bacillus alveayuensis]
MRIVSICPSNTEIAVWLGLEDQLIALDDYSDWPKKIGHLPRLGPDLSIDIDQLEQLKPDLVLSSLSVPGMERNVEELEKRGIPQLVLNPQSLEDIATDILKVGKACKIEKLAQQKANLFLMQLEKYKHLSSTVTKRPTVYFEWWPKPIFTPGKRNWLTEICEFAGGKNCFGHVELASVQTTWEDVVLRNPDYICLVWVGVKQEKMNVSHLLKRPNAENLQAVKNEKIYLLEEALYCRPSPRLLEGLQHLAQILHPTIYAKE